MRAIHGASVLSFALLPACEQAADVDDDLVTFADPALEACVREAVGLPEGEVFLEDLAGLVTLLCPDRGVADLAGLEDASDLENLSLWENEVTDLGPLADLASLHALEIGNNPFADAAPLAGLVQVERLGMAFTDVADLAPLAGMSALRWLNIDGTAVSDLGPLEALGALVWVTAERTGVDASALEDRGVEVYVDDDRRSSLPELPEARDGRPSGAQLTSVAESDDRARFDVVDTDGVRHRVWMATGGELRAEGRRVVLARGGSRYDLGPLGGRPCAELDSGCRATLGRKAGEGREVYTLVLSLADGSPAPLEGDPVSRDDGLLPFVLASPNQHDAGSCLFMTGTGTAEILLAQHADPSSVEYLGETDLSERFPMNAIDGTPASVVPYPLTDIVYGYDWWGGSMLSRDYPFTAGYVVDTETGLARATATTPGAYLSCAYNWFDDLPSDWEDQLVPTPDMERTLVFRDPDESPWGVALMDWDHVARIQHELRTHRAPVVIVYNHFLYWHANLVVGYDDEVETGGCAIVEQSIAYFRRQDRSDYADAVEDHMEDLGGCRSKGVFYVRDSIYEGDDEPMYTYNDWPQVTEPYSERIIELPYDWVVALGNHAYAVHRGRGGGGRR